MISGLSAFALNAVIFYGTGAVIFGMVFGCMANETDRFAGKKLRHPRFTAFWVCGLAWPYVVFKIVTG